MASNFVRTATIALNGNTSDVVDTGKGTLAGLFLPAALTGTAITFLVCDTEGGTYLELQAGAGSAFSVTVAASKYVALDPTKFIGLRYIKLKSGSTELAARAIRCLIVK